MKIAITSSGPTLESSVAPRFGRCGYFLIVDPQTMEYEAVENSNATLGGGAGIQSAQLLSRSGADTVLTGNCGPNAFRTLEAAGIQVIVGVSGSIQEAVEQYKAGVHTAVPNPNVASHYGMGSGGGSESEAKRK